MMSANILFSNFIYSICILEFILQNSCNLQEDLPVMFIPNMGRCRYIDKKILFLYYNADHYNIGLIGAKLLLKSLW